MTFTQNRVKFVGTFGNYKLTENDKSAYAYGLK